MPREKENRLIIFTRSRLLPFCFFKNESRQLLMNGSIVLKNKTKQRTKRDGARNFHSKGQTQFPAIFDFAKETARQSDHKVRVKKTTVNS